MWMVIFDHIGLENRGVSDWIWTFHMPLFFLVSGLFFRSDCSFKKQIIKDVKHLLLPFLLWHIIASFSWDIAQAFYFGGNDKWSYYWENQLLFWGGISCGYGWFLLALFFIRIEMKLLVKGSIVVQLLLVVLMAILGGWLHAHGWNMPFYVLNAFIACPFFFVGLKLKDNIMKVMERSFAVKDTIACFTLLFFLFGVSLALLSINGRGSIPSFEYGNYVILFYLQGLLGSMFILLLCKLLSFAVVWKPLQILGAGTLVMLLSQQAFILCFKVIYKKLMLVTHPAPYFPILDGIVVTCCIVALMYPCVLFINRHLPILNGRFISKINK